MHYVSQGQGPTIILLHGLFGDHQNLTNLGRQLAEAGYRVVRADLRNHGRSDWYDSMTLKEMADDLEALRIELGLQQIALVGHSLGGKVAMTYAQAYPEPVSALVVADIAPVGYEPRHQLILTTLSALKPESLGSRKEAQDRLQQAGIDTGTSAFLLKNLVPLEGGGFRWQVNLDAIMADYPHIIGPLPDAVPFTGPTLFIKGELSDYLLPHHQGEVKRRFPNAQARVIQGAGHWLHAEKPRLFNGQVLRFVQQHWPLTHDEPKPAVL